MAGNFCTTLGFKAPDFGFRWLCLKKTSLLVLVVLRPAIVRANLKQFTSKLKL